jgi:hypothetical protein
MKGIAHFAAGVAAASCFPGSIAAAENGNPLYFILGGVFGLLPDTIDFKFYRFFYRHDAEVIPDPLTPDPQLVADAVADAIRHANETGKPFRIKLNTIRLGADLWQRYTLRFNLPANRIEVEIGPKVDTGGTPVVEQKAESKKQKSDSTGRSNRFAYAPLPAPVTLSYEAETHIDIFEGPIFQMSVAKDGSARPPGCAASGVARPPGCAASGVARPPGCAASGVVVPEFIPWHRQWSHSILVGLMLAVPAWLIWDALAALVVAAAYAAHVALDQLGHMGSSLFWPLTLHRTPGLKLQHSGEALPNLAAVWLSCLLIFWNLAHYAARPAVEIDAKGLILWGAIIPYAAIHLVRKKLKN